MLALEEASFHERKKLIALKPLGYEEIQGSHVERESYAQPAASSSSHPNFIPYVGMKNPP